MNELYIHGDENKINKKQIEKVANEKFGDWLGWHSNIYFIGEESCNNKLI